MIEKVGPGTTAIGVRRDLRREFCLRARMAVGHLRTAALLVLPVLRP
jgi:hypothetical protein